MEKSIIVNELSKISENIASNKGNIDFEKVTSDRQNANLVIAEYANLAYESLTNKFKFEEMDGAKNELLSGSQVEINLHKMNPLLAKLLIIETLESDYINKRFGAFPIASAYCIKQLLELKKYHQFNSIENPVERLEALSLNLIHQKLNNCLANSPEIKQSDYVQVHLNKRLHSFELLPKKLQENLGNIDNLKIKRKLK